MTQRLALSASIVALLFASGCATRPPAADPQAADRSARAVAPGQPAGEQGRRSAARPAATPATGVATTRPSDASCPHPSTQTVTVPRRGGGYYLDDGPGDAPPPDLASIPDAEPRSQPLHRFANRPYVVFGRSYTPMTERVPYNARGVATWYGKRYHARKTSSGEVYDMYAMTGAHPTLPIPSYVRVTNIANRCSVIVRINDRGPFIGDRLIDLSYAAASRLGYIMAGSATVDVEKLIPGVNWPDRTTQTASDGTVPVTIAATTASPVPMVPAAIVGTVAIPTGGGAAPDILLAPLPAADAVIGGTAIGPAATAATAATATTATSVQPMHASAAAAATAMPLAAERGAGIFLQLGAFADRGNAETFLGRIRPELGPEGASAHVFLSRGLHRVHLGPYAAENDARSAADALLRRLGIRPLVTVR